MKICPASLVSRELPSASLWDKSHLAAILVRLWSLDVTKRLVYMKEEIWTNLAGQWIIYTANFTDNSINDPDISILAKYKKVSK